MIFHDFNQTLKPPEGYILVEMDARGAYLWLRYAQKYYWRGTIEYKGRKLIDIYLNNMGREVARLERFEPAPEPPVPLTREMRWYAALAQIKAGIQEMIRCLKNS